jgi:hypothetical protein
MPLYPAAATDIRCCLSSLTLAMSALPLYDDVIPVDVVASEGQHLAPAPSAGERMSLTVSEVVCPPTAIVELAVDS